MANGAGVLGVETPVFADCRLEESDLLVACSRDAPHSVSLQLKTERLSGARREGVRRREGQGRGRARGEGEARRWRGRGSKGGHSIV